jgi:hypothetical protein
VSSGRDPELAAEGTAERLTAPEPALPCDASEVGFTGAQQPHCATDACSPKKGQRRRPSELDEARACVLARAAEGSRKAGDPRIGPRGLDERGAQERIGEHPEEAAVSPAKIAEVTAERLDEEGLAEPGGDRLAAQLLGQHFLAQSVNARLE